MRRTAGRRIRECRLSSAGLCRCRTRRAAWPQRHKRIVSGRAVRRPHRPDGVIPLESFGMPSPTARNPLRVEAPGVRPLEYDAGCRICMDVRSQHGTFHLRRVIPHRGRGVGLLTALRRQTGVMGGTSEKAACAANGLGVTEVTLAGVIFEGGGFCTAPGSGNDVFNAHQISFALSSRPSDNGCRNAARRLTAAWHQALAGIQLPIVSRQRRSFQNQSNRVESDHAFFSEDGT